MEKIFICIFLLAVVPYAGLPRVYDISIYVVLAGALGYCGYSFLKKNIDVLEEPEVTENKTKKTEEEQSGTEEGEK